MCRLFLCALSSLLLCSQGSRGAAIFVVTEVYAGITGEDGTDDWFEVANLGDMPGDTGTIFYDDNSANPATSAPLSSIVLSPGQAAVFLISNSFGQDAAQFRRVWGPDSILGSVDGSGLGTPSDGVFLFDANLPGANVINSVSYTGSHDLTLATHVFDPIGNQSAAMIGVAGAFQSMEFFNDNLGDPDNLISLIGSPGIVPEPGTGSLVLLAMAAILARSRRQ